MYQVILVIKLIRFFVVTNSKDLNPRFHTGVLHIYN
jgi:hypothetical protein